GEVRLLFDRHLPAVGSHPGAHDRGGGARARPPRAGDVAASREAGGVRGPAALSGRPRGRSTLFDGVTCGVIIKRSSPRCIREEGAGSSQNLRVARISVAFSRPLPVLDCSLFTAGSAKNCRSLLKGAAR